MKCYNKEKPLISIHIPKTGGTSLQHLLRKWFGNNLYLHYFDEINNRMPKKQTLRPGMCIYGHFSKKRHFGIEDYYPEVNQFITFLRDPFEIVVSRYFDVKKREKKGEAFRSGKPFNLTDDIDQYLETEIQKKEYHPNILDYMPVEVTFSNYKELIHEYFIYIGVTEDFQFCIDKIAEKLDFPSAPLEHTNQSPRFKEFSSDQEQRFIDLHPLEYEVYNYVLENYKKM